MSINNVSFNDYIQNTKAGNKAEYTPALKPMPNDSVEISSKDNKKQKIKKALTLGAIVGTIGTIAFLIYKNKISEAKNLAQTIQFKKAATIEEAIEFGKKELGIKDYVGFDKESLEAINWLNEGLANTSNSLGGKIRMPKIISYSTAQTNAMAWVYTGGKYKGDMCVSKNFFSDIEGQINKRIEALEKAKFINKKDGKYAFGDLFEADELADLINKYKSGKLNFNDKIQLQDSLSRCIDFANTHKNSPYFFIKQFYKQMPDLEKVLGKLEDIQKLPVEKQHEIFEKITKQAKKSGKLRYEFIVTDSPFRTIYHEMGHLQDMIKRCPTTDKFNFDETKYPSELKEWVNDKWKQQVSNSVSGYASHGPGEFIAETFAQALSGKKLDDDVIRLYKELQGPSIPNITL